MLDEYKQLYRSYADEISNWKSLSKTELCNLYVEKAASGDYTSEYYLSAIIYRYWNLITHSYYSQHLKIAHPDDCYDFVLTGIMYALNQHAWLDPNSNLYGDPNGPDKAINICVKSERSNFFVTAQRQKRKINYEALSLEALEENSSDSYYLPYMDKNDFVENYVIKKVKAYFDRKEYFSAFVLDAIIYLDLFSPDKSDPTKTVFDSRKLKRNLHSIDDTYVRSFTARYDLDINEVRKSVTYIQNTTQDRMSRNISNLFHAISNDKEFLSYVR